MSIKAVKRDSMKFIPAYSGNREDSNPLWVLLNPLTRAEVDKYTKRTRYFQRQGFKGEWDSNALEIQKRQFLDNVIEVHNFLDAETDEEITDIERFYHEAPNPLIDEILEAVLDISQIGDVERKN